MVFLVFVFKELRTVFNSNIRTRFDIQVGVNDFYAQKAFDVYRGFLQLFTIRRRPTRQQSCSQLDDLLLVPSSLLKQVHHVRCSFESTIRL